MADAMSERDYCCGGSSPLCILLGVLDVLQHHPMEWTVGRECL